MKIVIILIFLFVLFFVYNTSKFGEQNVNFLDEPMFYIINVPGPMGEERRNYINNVFSKANIKYTFYSAYNKNKITTERAESNSKLKKGQIALAMTHNDLYKKLLESNNKYMLIAEDDCTFRSNFKIYLNKVINNLPDNFDIVKIGYISNMGSGHSYNMEDNPLVPYNSNTNIKFNDTLELPGTECYIVSRKGAKMLLEMNEPIWMPSDGAMDRNHLNKKIKKSGNIYYLQPPLAWQGNLKSILN